MTEERPFDERPAARPSEPAETTARKSARVESNQPKKVEIGTYGWVSIIAVGIAVIVGIVNGLVGNGNSSRSATDDPIEQARVVIGGGYKYDEIKVATDNALTAAGLATNDENRNRAWSSVISVASGSNVDEMAVMQCVPSQIAAAGSLSLPDAVAFCFTEMKLE